MPVTRGAMAVLLLIVPVAAGAQQGTQETIERARGLYDNFQIEAARTLFQQVISPGYQQQISTEQRVTALKYLGASYAVLGIPESAESFFVAALDYDPFTDLDVSKFSASELGPFNTAKQKIFKVGIRPITPLVVDPRADSTWYRFSMVTTHRANLTVELVRQTADTLKEVLFAGQSAGLKDHRWDGFLRSVGRIADSATYMLRVQGTSALPGGSSQSAVETQYFRVEHAYEPLEDTLPTLTESMRLGEQIPALAPWMDLVKGIFVGGVAFALPTFALNSDISWRLHSVLAAGVGAASGVISFAYRRQNRSIPENVRENARREQQRETFNAGVRARNDARLARTRLVITPVTGIVR